MTTSKQPLTAWLLVSFLVGAASPVIRDILHRVRMALLSEKQISQEVVVESMDFFEQLSVKDYAKAPELLRKDFAPLYHALDTISDQAINLYRVGAPHAEATIAQLELMRTTTAKLLSQAEDRASNESNVAFASLLQVVAHELRKLLDAIEAIQFKLPQRIDITRDIALVRDQSIALFNFLAALGLRFMEEMETRSDILEVQRFLIHKLRALQLDGLFDVETPYFSLPPEFAEAKEQRLISHLRIYKRDPAAIMALVQLYAEMRNLYDAQLLYRTFLDRVPLSKDLAQVRYATRAALDHYLTQTRYAQLADARISVHDDLSAEIRESYDVVGAESDDRIVAILPYPSDAIVIDSVTDGIGRPLGPTQLRPTWKNSSVLTVERAGALEELNLRYRSRGFAVYRDDTGKFEFRYGGLVAADRLSLDVEIPLSFKITALQNAPDQREVTDGTTRLRWLNPSLPYKFGALDFEAAKPGIAGEIADYGLLYRRLFLAIAVVVAFLLMSALLRHKWFSSLGGDLLYFLLAAGVIVILVFDLQFTQRFYAVLRRIDLTTIFRLLSVLWLGFFILARRRYEGNRPVRLAKCTFEVAAVGLVARLYLENIPLESRLQFGAFLACAAFFLMSLVEVLSREMKISTGTSVLTLAAVLVAVKFVSANLGLLEMPQAVMTSVGVLIGLALITAVGVLYVAYRRVVLNVPDVSVYQVFLDRLSIRLGPFAESWARLLLFMLIVVSLFYEAALVAFLVALPMAIAEPLLSKLVNPPTRQRKGYERHMRIRRAGQRK